MSGRVRVPPLVIVVPAIVPLLPGLAIYRGLALLKWQAKDYPGAREIAAEGLTACGDDPALAALFAGWMSKP